MVFRVGGIRRRKKPVEKRLIFTLLFTPAICSLRTPIA